MADRIRIVTRPDRGRRRTLTVLDLADPVAALIVPTRGTWKITAGAKAAQTVASGRRYGGELEVADKVGNVTVTRAFGVRGASADAALLNVERIIQATRDPFGLYLEWRPDGASRSSFFPLRGAAVHDETYEWVQFAGARLLEVALSFPVAPLAIGDACDFIEDWTGDTPLGDYTDRVGTGPVQITAGQLAPNGALGTTRRLMFTGRGYLDRDATRDAAATWGATLTGQRAGVVIAELDANNYVVAYLDDDGANTRIVAQSFVAGVSTAATVTNLGARLVAGQAVYVRGRLEGYVCTAEYFAAPPGPASTPTSSAILTLGLGAQPAGEKAIADAGGRGGLYWTPQSADARAVSYASRPWTFTKRPLPESVPLRGIPGTGPPTFDAQVTHVGGAAVPVFALLGYDRRPAPYSLLFNGDFEENVNGWSTAAVTNYNLASTSIVRTAGTPARPAKSGQWYARVTTPAVDFSGVSFKLYRRFRRGVTYTIVVPIKANAGGVTMQAAIGNEAGTDTANSGAAAAASAVAFTLYTIVWTPTADVDVAVLSIYQRGAAAATWDLDEVKPYEGTVAPTATRQAEGAGALPPFGILKAESSDPAAASGFALTADAGYLGAYGMKVTAAGAGVATLVHYIDPALLNAEEFGRGELDVEIWAVVELASTIVAPRIIQSAAPAGGGASRPNEWGAVGRALVLPSSGTRKRLVRVGVIRLPVNDPQRWKLTTTITYAIASAGVVGVDYLLAVPARRRASSPSGKANDAAYPRFITTLLEATKTILCNLAGRLALEPGREGRDLGLGGSALELPPPPNAGDTTSDAELLVKLSSLVPDDPTADATTEQLSHVGTVHAAITPTYYLTRPA